MQNSPVHILMGNCAVSCPTTADFGYLQFQRETHLLASLITLLAEVFVYF